MSTAQAVRKGDPEAGNQVHGTASASSSRSSSPWRDGAQATCLRDAGTVVVLEHESKVVLRDDALGDPITCAASRSGFHPITTRAPRAGGSSGFPACSPQCAHDMVGFTGSGLVARGVEELQRERAGARRAPSIHEQGAWDLAIMVFPDCFTALGGNQYVNSSAIGELRRLTSPRRRSFPSSTASSARSPPRDHRGCFGKSSGGYGAIIARDEYPGRRGRDRRSFGRLLLRVRATATIWPNTLNELRNIACADEGGPRGRARKIGEGRGRG